MVDNIIENYGKENHSCVSRFPGLSQEELGENSSEMMKRRRELGGQKFKSFIAITKLEVGRVYPNGREKSMDRDTVCLLYTSPSPRDRTRSRMPSSA